MPGRAVLIPVGLALAVLVVLALTFTPGHRGPPGDLLRTVSTAATTIEEVVMR